MSGPTVRSQPLSDAFSRGEWKLPKGSGFSIDVVLNPGNSGGPVLDKAGRVIGVVQGGVRGAGINFAIPVGRLSELLASPVVVLDAPRLSFNTRNTPANWTVRVVPPRGADNATVEVAVAADGGSPRTFAAKPSSSATTTPTPDTPCPGRTARPCSPRRGGLYSESLEQVGGELARSRSYIPSTVANYFVGLEGNRAMLLVTGTTAPLVVLGELNEFRAASGPHPNFNNPRDVIADKRIQFVPQANLLVTVPPDKDYIVLRRVNPIDLLKKSEIDYLFVESLPVTEARKGKAYE
jgi:hypothetical protein